MQHSDKMNPFRAIIVTIVNVQVVVMTKRGVNDGRTIPDDALGAAMSSAEAVIVLWVSTVKTMEAAHIWDASPPKVRYGGLVNCLWQCQCAWGIWKAIGQSCVQRRGSQQHRTCHLHHFM